MLKKPCPYHRGPNKAHPGGVHHDAVLLLPGRSAQGQC
jgi:hypothetical protein